MRYVPFVGTPAHKLFMESEESADELGVDVATPQASNEEFQLDSLLNNGLTLQDNFDGRHVEVVLDEGLNEIQHSLGHVPIGYLVLLQEGPGDFYAEDVDEWTKEILFVSSSVPNLKVRLFVM